MTKYITLRWFFSLALAALTALHAAPVVAGPPSPFAKPFSLEAGYEYQTPAEFDGGGEVQSKHFGMDAQWSLFSASYEYVDFDWSETAGLDMAPGSDHPIDSLHSISLGARYFDAISPEWGWFVGGGVSSAYEEEMEDSYGASLRGGFDWRYDDNWNVQFGAMVAVDGLGGSVFPIVRVNYDDVDKETKSGLFGTVSYPESSLGYQFDETFTLTARLGRESATYRLADDSPIESEGYLTTTDHYLDLDAVWNVAESWHLTLGPRILFARSWEIADSDGDDDDDYDLDGGLGAFASVKFTF